MREETDESSRTGLVGGGHVYVIIETLRKVGGDEPTFGSGEVYGPVVRTQRRVNTWAANERDGKDDVQLSVTASG